ncbi:FecCD family ABC transporter permease [Pseudohaliea rubra]|uniref:Vitamin B12 ABC transporter, permease component BtuC n=1 Tax=Pseudohaliea rubra DSM 19751 TaxID=1265313 RepID=A0A095VNG0_9GAMM|nr:iron ABC transporter permease [Pseudohaliea rubra]KGE03007.1 Vitamin B12 ABC transporter, permease component BtuC [Pseudohaliea rubra DSM 19751]
MNELPLPWRQLWPLRAIPLPEPRLLALAALMLLAAATGVSVGAVPVPVLDLLLDRSTVTPLQAMVFSELRLPRVVLAGMVGAGLALAGACLQGLFRNPLAEPQLIGVSSGAALGAIAMIVFGEALALPEALSPYSLPAAAILGAVTVTGALYAFASRRGQGGVTTLLLVGIAVNALAGVGIGLFTWLANDGELRSLTFWSMGSFGGTQWRTALPAMALIALATAYLLPAARRLDLLQLGELEAARLGVCVVALKRRLVFGVAVAVGAGVAVAGIIGFVGLVVPHIARLLGGVHHRYVLPASALLGATLAITADLGARTLVVPAEMPVGLITSAIGAPFFLWLVLRLRR